MARAGGLPCPRARRGPTLPPPMIYLLHAHPHPLRSRANRALLAAVEDLPSVTVRSLYDAYPDFAIDVERERAALAAAHTVVWQHPLYWYSVPGMLKHWFDEVLGLGWAYGAGGTALHGKRALWVVTTGADAPAYTPEGPHAHPFPTFEPPIRQTARFCGMEWLEPIVVHWAHRISEADLAARARAYRERLATLLGDPGALPSEARGAGGAS